MPDSRTAMTPAERIYDYPRSPESQEPLVPIDWKFMAPYELTDLTPVERRETMNPLEQETYNQQQARLKEWHMHQIDPDFKLAKSPTELHIALDIPKQAATEVYNWVQEQDWPKGTELEPLEDYHITMLYAPETGDDFTDNGWPHDHHAVTVTGIKAFPSKEHGDKNAIVLTIESDTIRDHHDQLADRAEDHGIEISPYSHDDYEPHITVAYGELPKGLKAPKLTFETAESSVSEPRDDTNHIGRPRESAWRFGTAPRSRYMAELLRFATTYDWEDDYVPSEWKIGQPTAKIADSWQPKTVWPNALRERNGEPVDADCTCQDGHKLNCPVHGMHPELPTYDDTLEFPNPASPVGYDYHADGPRTWMRAETKTAAGIAVPLPMHNGLYYRAHNPEAPWGSEYAETTPLEPGLEHYRKPGYSAFWNPHHLREYMNEQRWDPENEGRWVVAFHGTPIGGGVDGEPRVRPSSPTPEFALPWSEFEDRLENTENGYGKWYEHTWGEGPEGQIRDDGYRSLGELTSSQIDVRKQDSNDDAQWTSSAWHFGTHPWLQDVGPMDEHTEGPFWHITHDPNFKIDPDYAPTDLSSMGGEADRVPALMVSDEPHIWAGTFHSHPEDLANGEYENDKPRMYAAEIEPIGPFRPAHRGFGPEYYMENPAQNARVKRVVPLEQALMESDPNWQPPQGGWDTGWRLHAKAKTKLWLDDSRRPPDKDWTWAKNVAEAQHLLKEDNLRFDTMSLDHDLGMVQFEGKAVINPDALSGGDFILWLIEHGDGKHLPKNVILHTHNHAAVELMCNSLKDHVKNIKIERAPDHLEEDWAKEFKVHEPSEIEKEEIHLPEKIGHHQLAWLPGSNLPGKGLVTPSGDVHTWPVDEEGAPHHAQYVDAHVPYQLGEGQAHFFKITPRGRLDTESYAVSPQVIHHILKTLPGLRAGEHTDWHFAGETNPQQMRKWEQLQQEYPSTSQVAYQWPDNWTMQYHPGVADIKRIGNMMHNCWQKGSQGENHMHYSLHDPTGLPQVAITRIPTRKFGIGDVVIGDHIGQALGSRNQRLMIPDDQDKLDRINQWAEKEGMQTYPDHTYASWHFGADKTDTRQYPDTRMMPATDMREPAQQNAHPEAHGCTCEEGEKLTCPVHGLNPDPEQQGYDHSWSVPQGHPVGYPESGPRNYYMKAEGANHPVFLYHGAPTEDRARILTHGLIPSLTHLNPEWGTGGDDLSRQPEGVYLAHTPYDASWLGAANRPDIWEVDSRYLKDLQSDPVIGHAHYTPHAIPPEALALYEGWEEKPESQDQPRNYMKAEGSSGNESGKQHDAKANGEAKEYVPEQRADDRRKANQDESRRVDVHWRIVARAHPAWLDQWMAQHGPYAYHGSDEDFDAEIARNGLMPWNQIPNYKPGIGQEGELGQPRPNHIYMSTTPPHPEDYSRIYKIDLRKLNPENLNPDEDWYSDAPGAPPINSYTGQGAEDLGLGDDPAHTHTSMEWGKFSHRGPIPPEAISIHEPPREGGDWAMTGLPRAEGAVDDEDEHEDNLEGDGVKMPEPPEQIKRKQRERKDQELVEESRLLPSGAWRASPRSSPGIATPSRSTAASTQAPPWLFLPLPR